MSFFSDGSQANILQKYMSLDTSNGPFQVLYVWIDGSGETMRCKTKTVYEVPKLPSDLPIWNFDGSSTKQAEGLSILHLYKILLFAFLYFHVYFHILGNYNLE